MISTWAKVVSQLTRLDTSAIAFFSLVLPLYSSTSNLRYSIVHSLPILTISMSGFVINDLHDIDKDKTNHPYRPLPSQKISPVAACILYFVLLTLSLALIKATVEPPYIYIYLLLLVGLINYNYVVSYIPSLKDFYVATIGIFPLFILSSLLPEGRGHAPVTACLFLFLLGREMLMDIEDFAGDGETLVKKIGVARSTYIAFGAKFFGSLILSLQVNDLLGAVIWFTVVASDLLFLYLWAHSMMRATVLFCMKLQLLVGIYYLI
jgi:geranylgeranylglycerol-phosphate geranylgeranyltransferase